MQDNKDVGMYMGSPQERRANIHTLTGFEDQRTFFINVSKLVEENEEAVAAGEYAAVFLDVFRFKGVNDVFGMEEGDRLLLYIAEAIRSVTKENDAICHPGADRFIVFTHTFGEELEKMIKKFLKKIADYDLPLEITCNLGIYVTNEEKISVDLMVDRAVLAQEAVKGSYTTRYNYFTAQLRDEMITKQEIVGMMATALAEEHFVLYYQPQYDHSTGCIVGAEALVRWNHPEKGLISPGIFIPIFEDNGFITKLDLYVFEHVCKFVRKCMDEGKNIVPISSNFSRHDIFMPDLVEKLEAIRKKYDVPVQYLRVEITESAVVGNSHHVCDVVDKLHQCGYIVEMDDFGTGYSSLNVLKDIDLDILKLDMLFLKNDSNNNRGGIIVSSIVRMAKWLGLPVIAEGVETVEQADFLKSVGSDYIQGYLYSRPLPQEQYEELVEKSTLGNTEPKMELIEQFNAFDFWNPQSQETLIFNNYVGGAAIFEYRDGEVEFIRVNEKYLKELSMNLTEKDIIRTKFLEVFDDTNKKIFTDTLKRAITTMDEQECETWRTYSSACCGNEKICIRSTVRVIGKSADSYIIYGLIRNITAEKEYYGAILDSERRFKMASEQVNIYYWEYTVATREMRPCFRCMRDLGLPALLTNYPDSAIEMGVFPPEVADMYRDWHHQIGAGVPELEAVMPLTENRVPFRVKYTTEFDASGKPVKAYGSAALVV